ncbi:MAG: hypothetical protein NC212_10955 [Staphylococcus sp.]|nr:hypothetical protein [Staphylococcus sp.]
MTTETTQKVKISALNSANVRIDNSADAEATFRVEANVDIANGNTNGFSGEVRKDNAIVASFNCYNSGSYLNNLSLNYHDVDPSEQAGVLGAVQKFITDTQAFVTASGASIIAF